MRAVVTLTLVFGSTMVWADDDAVLTHNPFTRPSLGAVATGADGVAVSSEPELRATLVGGRVPLANISGRLLTIGDELDGLRLVGISEGAVELQSGARRITITLPEVEAETTVRRKR